MAVLVLGLFATGRLESFAMPLWVVAFSALAIGVGTFVGGKQLIRTLGAKFYKIRPIEGFSAQIASSAVLFGAGLLGGPVSGSQVVTSAIVGAGSADRVQKVRWDVVERVLLGWVVTIPFSALLSAALYELVEKLVW
jgi:PiT family inorganic phosphate transporter